MAIIFVLLFGTPKVTTFVLCALSLFSNICHLSPTFQNGPFRIARWSSLFSSLLEYDRRFREALQSTGEEPTFLLGDARVLEAYCRVLKKVCSFITRIASSAYMVLHAKVRALLRVLQIAKYHKAAALLHRCN
jgi:hypothetical protein